MVSGGDDCEAKLWDLRQKRSVKTLGEKYQVGGSGGRWWQWHGWVGGWGLHDDASWCLAGADGCG